MIESLEVTSLLLRFQGGPPFALTTELYDDLLVPAGAIFARL